MGVQASILLGSRDMGLHVAPLARMDDYFSGSMQPLDRQGPDIAGAGMSMKPLSVLSLLLLVLLGCDGVDRVVDSNPAPLGRETVRVDPLFRLLSGVDGYFLHITDSIHVVLRNGSGSLLLDKGVRVHGDSALYMTLPRHVPVQVRFEGFGRGGGTIWAGAGLLPGFSSDTTCIVPVDTVDREGWNGKPVDTLREPDHLGTDAVAWAGPATFDSAFHALFAANVQGAQLRYTLDGSEPTDSSPICTNEGILVDTTVTIRVIQTKPHWIRSKSRAMRYVLKAQSTLAVATDVDPWMAGTWDRPVTVTLTSPTHRAEIHCTLDGSVPTRSSPLCGPEGIRIDAPSVLKARTFAGKAEPGDEIFEQAFAFQAQPPAFGGSLDGFGPHRILLTSPAPGAAIHYTLEARDPTSADPLFPAEGLEYSDSVHVRAMAIDTRFPHFSGSSVVQADYGVAFPWNPAIAYGTLKDLRDGHSYRTVSIGAQTWMAENLNYVPNWVTAGSWCYDQDTANCRRYGRLYDWATAMDMSEDWNAKLLSRSGRVKGLCPTGWHVPSNMEWQELTAVAMDSATAGVALRSTTGWGTDEQVGKDAYGFRMLPAGMQYDGRFNGFAYASCFVTSSEEAAAGAWIRLAEWSRDDVRMDMNFKVFAGSLRCVKDQ
ncbi:MAG: hypothetical protein RL318_2610 [Fibrobacterota bacterium]|jgi:uncharacterized protein (TIGR02145 family)